MNFSKKFYSAGFASFMAFAPAGLCASETSPDIVSVRNKPPLVSFDLYVAGRDGVIKYPKPTSERNSVFDSDGVYATVIDGKQYRHIATIASQASGTGATNLDIEAEIARQPRSSPERDAALGWLERNGIPLEGDAVVWHYTFDHTFNTLVIKGGWPSAFAQADAIKALILAYLRTKQERYRTLAVRAAHAFQVPCERGGLRCEVGGVPWFEELPVPYGHAPMILNGHLYALAMLHKLSTITNSPRVKAAYDEGLASARKVLLRYDTGYWSQYQLRPRVINLFFVLKPSSSMTELREVTARSPFTAESAISFGGESRKTYPTNVAWGGLGPSTSTGRALSDVSFVQLTPGRFSIENDPVNFPGFDVQVKFSAPDCAEPTLATYDWRATSKDWMALPGQKVERAGDECILRASLPTSVNQFSQIDTFYHDWHTRLVTEIWRTSRDATFYTTALRWRRYAALQKEHEVGKTEGLVLKPVFDVTESPEDDTKIRDALKGEDPSKLTDDEIKRRLAAYAKSTGLSAERATALLQRVGQ